MLTVEMRLLQALIAAMEFIDSHVADPDITAEMHFHYTKLQDLEPHQLIEDAQQWLTTNTSQTT